MHGHTGSSLNVPNPSSTGGGRPRRNSQSRPLLVGQGVGMQQTFYNSPPSLPLPGPGPSIQEAYYGNPPPLIPLVYNIVPGQPQPPSSPGPPSYQNFPDYNPNTTRVERHDYIPTHFQFRPPAPPIDQASYPYPGPQTEFPTSPQNFYYGGQPPPGSYSSLRPQEAETRRQPQQVYNHSLETRRSYEAHRPHLEERRDDYQPAPHHGMPRSPSHSTQRWQPYPPISRSSSPYAIAQEPEDMNQIHPPDSRYEQAQAAPTSTPDPDPGQTYTMPGTYPGNDTPSYTIPEHPVQEHTNQEPPPDHAAHPPPSNPDESHPDNISKTHRGPPPYDLSNPDPEKTTHSNVSICKPYTQEHIYYPPTTPEPPYPFEFRCNHCVQTFNDPASISAGGAFQNPYRCQNTAHSVRDGVLETLWICESMRCEACHELAVGKLEGLRRRYAGGVVEGKLAGTEWGFRRVEEELEGRGEMRGVWCVGRPEMPRRGVGYYG